MRGLLIMAALVLAVPALSQVRVISIYLHPRAAGSDLTLGDIADFEGDAEMVKEICGMKLDSALWSDGFIDRAEVLSLLEPDKGISCCVYGSAVRVERTGTDVKTPSLNRGDEVTVFVIKNGVRLRTRGTVLGQCNVGDTVRVRTSSNAVIEGRVMKDGTVEKIL